MYGTGSVCSFLFLVPFADGEWIRSVGGIGIDNIAAIIIIYGIGGLQRLMSGKCRWHGGELQRLTSGRCQ